MPERLLDGPEDFGVAGHEARGDAEDRNQDLVIDRDGAVERVGHPGLPAAACASDGLRATSL